MKELNENLIVKKEGFAKFYMYKIDNDVIPSKSMNVFYNKKMIINRDISNLAINAYNQLYDQDLRIIDSMAASGIGSIRILLECENIRKIYINDINPVAIDLIRKNLILNELDEIFKDQIKLSNKEANYLCLELAQNRKKKINNNFQRPNIVSIDPFGTPNKYVDSAFKVIQNKNGLICITATDTAVLFGIRPEACLRKYMSKPLHVEYCKEVGARILLHFISRMANVNDLGIIPLLTFYSNHFIRIFALTVKDQKQISDLFRNYGHILHCKKCNYRMQIDDNFLKFNLVCPICKDNAKMVLAGPLWIGKIHDEVFLTNMINQNNFLNLDNKKKIEKILQYALDEINMPISYYDVHKLSQKLKLSNVPEMEAILDAINQEGFKASRTHFDFTAIKTDMNILQLMQLFSREW